MARQITELAVNAFLNKKNFKKDNTRIEYNSIGNVSRMYLFDNLIANLDFNNGELIISTAYWNTNTTRERLNGLPKVNVYQRKGQLHLNGERWNGEPIAIDISEVMEDNQ